jgi:AcrR family transcriptional regulator
MAIRNSHNGARRERAREHARRDILLAAAEVFARRGYAAATLQELAEAAGFAAPSLYRYFESKEELFRSLVELVVREMDQTFEEPVDRDAPLAARLETLLLAQARLAATLRPAIDLLQRAGPELPGMRELGLGSPRAGLAYYEARLLGWLRKHAAASELRHPPEVAARVLAGVAFAFHDGEGARPAEPAHTRLVLDLALHGFAAPAERRRGASHDRS